MMSPGHYLQLRRRAAGLSVLATASALVALPAALRRATSREINRMAERLYAAEADTAPLNTPQIRLLADVVPLDHGTYARLSVAHQLGIDAHLRICTGCGCTDLLACAPPSGPCAWSANQPDLCTACEEDHLADLVATAAQIAARYAVATL